MTEKRPVGGGTHENLDIIAVTPQLTPAPDPVGKIWEDRDVVANEETLTISSREIECGSVSGRKGSGDGEKPYAHGDQRQTLIRRTASGALGPRGEISYGEREAKSDELQGAEKVGDGGFVARVGEEEGCVSLEQAQILGEGEMATKDKSTRPKEDPLNTSERVGGTKIVARRQSDGIQADMMDTVRDAASKATNPGEEVQGTFDADGAGQISSRELNVISQARAKEGHRRRRGWMDVLISDSSDGETDHRWIGAPHQNSRRVPSLSSLVVGSETLRRERGAMAVPRRITTGEMNVSAGSEANTTGRMLGKQWRRDSFIGGVPSSEAEPGGAAVELVGGIATVSGSSSSSRCGHLTGDAGVVAASAIDADDVNVHSAEVARDDEIIGPDQKKNNKNEGERVGEHTERETHGETRKEECSTDILEGEKDSTARADKKLVKKVTGIPSVLGALAAGEGTPAGEISGAVPHEGSRDERGWVAGLERGDTEEPKPVSGGGRQLQPRPFTIFVSTISTNRGLSSS